MKNRMLLKDGALALLHIWMAASSHDVEAKFYFVYVFPSHDDYQTKYKDGYSQ